MATEAAEHAVAEVNGGNVSGSIRPGRRERVELVVADMAKLKEGQFVDSRVAGPAHMFRIRVAMGTNIGFRRCRWIRPVVGLLAPEGQRDYPITVRIFLNLRNNDPSLNCCRNTTRTFTHPDMYYGCRLIPFADAVAPGSGWLNENGCRLECTVVFPLSADRLVSKMWPRLDFTQKLGQVTFRLAEEPPVFFDERLLVARSDYFREMLSQEAWKEGRTREVDFSLNPRMNHRHLQAILQFLTDGTFDSEGDTTYALSVRCLADEYRLAELVSQADKELECLLSEDNVLEFLGHVQGRYTPVCTAPI